MERIELQVHAVHMVALKSLKSAGYRWTAAVDNPAVAVFERVEQQPKDLGEPPRAGADRDELFQVTAIAPGETVIRFSQARSFERDKPPRATHELLVVVR